MTRLVLVRHASTDSDGRLCGSFDVPLSAAGERQLQALVARVRPRTAPDALFTSTLRRAQRVAVALGRAWALVPQPAEWAREIHCGEVEGMPFEEVQRRFPERWARNAGQRDDNFAWPGGESYAGFRRRIMAGLRDALDAHPGARVMVVTHAGVISQVLGVIRHRRAAAWEADRPRPLTATEITWHRGTFGSVLRYNDPDWC